MAKLFTDYRKELVVFVAEQTPEASVDLVKKVSEQVHFVADGPQIYSIEVCHDGVTSIRYDLAAALTVALGLVGGLVGATLLSAVVAVLTCLVGIRGIHRRISNDEAEVLLALHSRGGELTLSELCEVVRQQRPELSEEEIKERLFDLVQLEAASVVSDIAKLEERVFVRYSTLRLQS